MISQTNRRLAWRALLVYAALVAGCTALVPTETDFKVASVEVFGNSEVRVGESITLHTLLKNKGGSTIQGTVVWGSQQDYVTVDAATGVVTGVREGTALILAMADGGALGTKAINVTPAQNLPVASVTVSGPASLKLYQEGTFEAQLKDVSGHNVTRPVTWTSSDPAKASVGSSTGVVTANALGTVTITGTSEGITGTAQLSVTPAAVNRVEVVGQGSLQVGASVGLSVHLYDLHNVELTGRQVTWSSSNQTSATVDATGRVTGLAVGSTTIAAASEDKSGSLSLTVVAAVGLQLSGRVIAALSGTGLSGASVEVLRASDQVVLGTATSTPEGNFLTSSFTMPAGGVYVAASLTGYVPGRVLVVTQLTSSPVSMEPIPLVPASNQTGGIAGFVKNARNQAGIANATVTLYNNVLSAPLLQVSTDGLGFYSISGLAAGTYRVVGSAPSYQPAERVGIAVGNGGVTNAQDLVLSPAGTSDVRIVLTWGIDPEDLDSHLTGPNPDGSTRFHIFFEVGGSLTAAPFAALDVDETDSFGPETITIAQVNPGGVYRYSVHDFSNNISTTSKHLSNSGAKVQVYSATGLVATFAVPSNKVGTLWTVFELTGSVAGPVITPINTFSNVFNPLSIPSPPAALVAGDDAQLIARAVQLHGKPRRRLR